MLRLFVAVLIVMSMSCSPRFTVYLDFYDRMNTAGIVPLQIDTVNVQGRKQRRVKYAMEKDMGSLERLFLSKRIKKAKKDIDIIRK